MTRPPPTPPSMLSAVAWMSACTSLPLQSMLCHCTCFVALLYHCGCRRRCIEDRTQKQSFRQSSSAQGISGPASDHVVGHHPDQIPSLKTPPLGGYSRRQATCDKVLHLGGPSCHQCRTRPAIPCSSGGKKRDVVVDPIDLRADIVHQHFETCPAVYELCRVCIIHYGHACNFT